MASQLVREWTGIQQFPTATQDKLLELLGKLKQENVNTLTILVMGKGGVGKSSTVNSILGERVATVSAFQAEALRPVMFSRKRAGFTLNIIDTPGLIEGGYVNEYALEITKRFLLNKTIDVLLYVDRLDCYRVDNLDRQVVKTITETFGIDLWKRGLVVLTHAQLSQPDGLTYDEFLSKRSEAVLRIVRLGARIRKQNFQAGDSLVYKDESVVCLRNGAYTLIFESHPIPVVLVENGGRCATDELGQKVLPNGTVWIPTLVEKMFDVISSGSKPIVVDRKLIEGPNPNERGKLWIPIILALQYFFLVKPIRRAINDDIDQESRPLWELRDMGLADRLY